MKSANQTAYEKMQSTKKKILKGAIHVFSNYPYGTASIRMIGEAAGIDHPLVNYHFTSKAALFEKVIERLVGEYFQAHFSWFEGHEQLDRKDSIIKYLDRFIAFASEQPGLLRVIALNLIQPEGHQAIPGYDRIQAFLEGTKQTFINTFQWQGTADDIDMIVNSFNSLALNYLGAGPHYAGKLGLKPQSLQYRKWVKETLIFLFLPRFLELASGPRKKLTAS